MQIHQEVSVSKGRADPNLEFLHHGFISTKILNENITWHCPRPSIEILIASNFHVRCYTICIGIPLRMFFLLFWLLLLHLVNRCDRCTHTNIVLAWKYREKSIWTRCATARRWNEAIPLPALCHTFTHRIHSHTLVNKTAKKHTYSHTDERLTNGFSSAYSNNVGGSSMKRRKDSGEYVRTCRHTKKKIKSK